MTKGLLYETHVHTELCGHSIGRPEDYAEVAVQRGLRGLIVTCHNPMPHGFTHVSHFIHRERRDVPIAAARSSLRPADWAPVAQDRAALASTPDMTPTAGDSSVRLRSASPMGVLSSTGT